MFKKTEGFFIGGRKFMKNRVLLNKINEKITQIELQDNIIIVLKGIPLSVVDSKNGNTIDLSEVVSNKLGYFMNNIFGKRKFITYEEFLLISDFIVSQYKNVYILNNNVYMKQYPIDECFPNEVRTGIINHFIKSDDNEDEDVFIGDIYEYISLYSGVKEYNGYLLGAYCDDKALNNIKVVNINLFERYDDKVEYASEDVEEFIDIVEESDYIDFVKEMFSEPDEIYIRTTNYTGDINQLNDHIRLISYYWKGFSCVYYVKAQSIEDSFEHRDAYNEILKKYWGYDDFRKIPVYDMAKLEEGKKEIVQVSQENIISNLVQQVENCGEDNKDFRDVFVTAPTGAGKSVMFQIPAIYIAEQYNLLTIVISPLIGLMNDQVKNLEVKNYKYAKTINSDISPIIKQEIMGKVADSRYHILYISPETLLSRSCVEQLIGQRTIGMIVIDEAHIVTTWGKQFRPDYWYLGDHINKLRKNQIEKKGRAFVISTFTATAIYHGLEDMYTETRNSLHMYNPIIYLGYVKRNDIDIVIDRHKKEKGGRTEYELDKFDQIVELVKRVKITNKKTLIYFPTVALINRCYDYLKNKKMVETVALYYGSLDKDKKDESYEKFYNKEKTIMLATKAFGMGIDINDIEIVYHFAPTGNVCDYVQEIGRAARRSDLRGEALFHYDSRDFKHINRLHGLSTIRRYQLIEVIKKIDELYQNSLQKGKRGDFTKKRNAMLLDAENFTYIFGSPINEDDNNINKVKTALLIIQKDFENKIGFSPINVRPIPLFSIGFFEIDENTQKSIQKKYPGCFEEIEPSRNICRVFLDKIWRKDYTKYSFPKFKYMLYSNDEELTLTKYYIMRPVLCVTVTYANDYSSLFKNVWDTLKTFIHKKVLSSEHTAVSEIAEALKEGCPHIGKYKAEAICEVIIASMDSYRKYFAKSSSTIAREKTTVDGKTKYQFDVAVDSYFQWVESGFYKIQKENDEGKLYLINDTRIRTKEYSVILGILEAIDVLSFEMLGGANSQLYIYINQIQGLRNILNAPYNYNNRLLNIVAERHLISVKMLTYIYEGDFTNEQIWDLLENYFLGVIPEKVKRECKKEKPDISFD